MSVRCRQRLIAEQLRALVMLSAGSQGVTSRVTVLITDARLFSDSVDVAIVAG